jgi:hypothetical protein
LEAPSIHGGLLKLGFCGHSMNRRQCMVNTGLVGSVVVGKSKIVEGDYCAASAFSHNQIHSGHWQQIDESAVRAAVPLRYWVDRSIAQLMRIQKT